ncbi:MAG: HAD family phosphatase [Verrucomicrobia bacterium]|nr:HAD family phosphatase [Verrucomicrobiota bacterium]
MKAVIFDCDGVLVDTEYLKFQAWQKALEEVNVVFTLEEYMPLVGHSAKNILGMIATSKGVDIPETVIEKRNHIYWELQRQGVPPIPEMIGVLQWFKNDRPDVKIGLASSAPREEILVNLRHIGLENAFDVIVSGHDDLDAYEDAEGKNKPKPYIYIEAATRLGIAPSKCVVFEDTAAGVEAAAGAGMYTIAVPNRFTKNQDFSKANQIYLQEFLNQSTRQ